MPNAVQQAQGKCVVNTQKKKILNEKSFLHYEMKSKLFMFRNRAMRRD